MTLFARRSFKSNALVAVIALACSVLFASCSKKSEASRVPSGSPVADFIRFTYAVYMLPDRPAHRPEPLTVLREALSREFTGPKLVAVIPKEPQDRVIHAHLQKDVKKEFPPPDLTALQYLGRGISAKEVQALQNSDEAFVLDFAHPKQDVWIGLRAANALIEEVARKSGGLIWDEETREIFSGDSWHKKRVESWVDAVPEVSTQTVIHAYNNDEYVRAITGKRDEGDSENRLIELALDRYPGIDVHAKQDSMLTSFFGAEESVAVVQRNNQELLEASDRAKAKLPELHKAFAAGLQPGEFIELNAPFRTQDGGTEWMWVEVTSWTANRINGLLKNEPGLHAGQNC